MNRLGLRAGLLPLVFLCFLFSGCASYYKVYISGDRPEVIESVYVIVAENNPLAKSDMKESELVSDPEQQFLLFAEFLPSEGAPLTWTQHNPPPSIPEMIKLVMPADHRMIRLRVNRKMLETYSELTVLVIGHGSEGWYHWAAKTGQIRLESGMRLQTAASQFLPAKM